MSASELRDAILAALPEDVSLRGEPPKPEWIHIPATHARALHLDASLVIGGRGSGKSYWWAALQNEDARAVVQSQVPVVSELAVQAGHGEVSDNQRYPDPETFERLIGDLQTKPFDVWRAIAARWIAGLAKKNIPKQNWRATLTWTQNNPEELSHWMEEANQIQKKSSVSALLVFDALDRISNSWSTTNEIIRDLLRFALRMSPFSHLKVKIFLREDQFEGRSVTDFPDASKLRANRADLTWGLLDLHGLLWQYLINAPSEHGHALRGVARQHATFSRARVSQHYRCPPRLRHDESTQRAAFADLAGKRMGSDHRRGIPYTWVVSHLADARGRASPRSFIAAIRRAAEDSKIRYASYGDALHYESIKRGVQRASSIRVDEIREEYAWLPKLMAPLKGLTVPCHFTDIEKIWLDTNSLEEKAFANERLPPEHLDQGAAGVIEDLHKLGVFEPVANGRVNMPDLYRVGFQLGRRGGVRPVARD